MNRSPRAWSAEFRGLLWISPWLTGFLLFMVWPLVMSLYYSFTDYSVLEPPVYVGTENYRELLTDKLVWIAVRNTAFYAAWTIPLGTLLALALAMLLDRPGRLAPAIRAIVFLPTLVPVVAAALSWMWLYNGEYGLINAGLRSARAAVPSPASSAIPTPDWLGDPRWAMFALILMSLWSVGGAVVIYGAALRDIPRSLREAAQIDGISPLGRALHITLPMLSPVILFNIITAIIWSLQVFAVPLIMTEGGPNNATYFYTMYIYSNAFAYGRMGYACALGWLQFAMIVGLSGVTLALGRKLVFYRGA